MAARLTTRDPAERGLQTEVPAEHVDAGAQQRRLHDTAFAGSALLEHAAENPRQRRERGDVITHRAPRVQRLVPAGKLVRQPTARPERAEVPAFQASLAAE